MLFGSQSRKFLLFFSVHEVIDSTLTCYTDSSTPVLCYLCFYKHLWEHVCTFWPFLPVLLSSYFSGGIWKSKWLSFFFRNGNLVDSGMVIAFGPLFTLKRWPARIVPVELAREEIIAKLRSLHITQSSFLAWTGGTTEFILRNTLFCFYLLYYSNRWLLHLWKPSLWVRLAHNSFRL